jgi:hypothetical protein
MPNNQMKTPEEVATLIDETLSYLGSHVEKLHQEPIHQIHGERWVLHVFSDTVERKYVSTIVVDADSADMFLGCDR